MSPANQATRDEEANVRGRAGRVASTLSAWSFGVLGWCAAPRTLRVLRPPSFIRKPASIIGIAALAAAIVVLTPSVAFAHGVTGAGGPWYTYIWSGFIHMLAGWDHLLFVAGILLLAREIKLSAKLISLFALGHSATLILATMAGWRISPTAVDVVIALSLVFVGLWGLYGKQFGWRVFGAAVLGFGLIHGLGLSTRLQDIGLPEQTGPLLARVVAFNLGVELGQLLAVVFMFMAADVIGRYLSWQHTTRATHGTLTAVGVVAALLLATGVIGVPSNQDPAQASGLGTCQVRKRTETYPDGSTGGHPQKDFFEPNETTPMKDFSHVLGDGMVLVHYRPDLTDNQLAVLRAFITGQDGAGVLAGPAPGQTEAYKAVNAFDTMVCPSFDLKPLMEFKKTWFADPRSRGQ